MQIGHLALTLELKYFTKHSLQAKLLQLGHDKGSFTDIKQIIHLIKSETLSDIFRLIESIKNERRKEMRVKSINNVDAFFKALDKCKGRVELITDEKDVLNLASKLTQFIGLTRVFSNPEISSYEIVCYNIDDYQYIKEFLVQAED